MTEAEWLACLNLGRMMDFIEWRISERKLILFGCAYCYRQWVIIPNDCCKNAVETGERFADGLCDERELRQARKRVEEKYPNLFWYQEYGCHAEAASYFAAFDTTAAKEMESEHPLDVPGNYLAVLKRSEVAGLIACAVWWPQSPTIEEDWERETAAQCSILRDIFGNPFRPLPPRPEAIAPLAEQIYASQWELMPLLGEWLQEHGYWSEGEHCLDPKNQHVKGCWVVDWVTGRA